MEKMNNQLSISEEQKEYTRFQFPKLLEEDTDAVGEENRRELMHVSLEVVAQLGKVVLYLSDILALSEKPEELDLNELAFLDPKERKKYLIELDKDIGVPINLLINGEPFATGEIIFSQEGDEYKIRIVSIISDEEETEGSIMPSSQVEPQPMSI